MTADEQLTTKFGFVSVVGAPNAGKSTLVNQLVGTKVSIVSPKVQTTRTRVTGILAEDGARSFLLIPPASLLGRSWLEQAMVRFWTGAEEGSGSRQPQETRPRRTQCFGRFSQTEVVNAEMVSAQQGRYCRQGSSNDAVCAAE